MSVRARASTSFETSSSTTECSDCASAWARPVPMTPAPMTPIVRNGCILPSTPSVANRIHVEDVGTTIELVLDGFTAESVLAEQRGDRRDPAVGVMDLGHHLPDFRPVLASYAAQDIELGFLDVDLDQV